MFLSVFVSIFFVVCYAAQPFSHLYKILSNYLTAIFLLVIMLQKCVLCASGATLRNVRTLSMQFATGFFDFLSA